MFFMIIIILQFLQNFKTTVTIKFVTRLAKFDQVGT